MIKRHTLPFIYIISLCHFIGHLQCHYTWTPAHDIADLHWQVLDSILTGALMLLVVVIPYMALKLFFRRVRTHVGALPADELMSQRYYNHMKEQQRPRDGDTFPAYKESVVALSTRWGRFKRWWGRRTGRIVVGAAFDPGMVIIGADLVNVSPSCNLEYEYDTKTNTFLITDIEERPPL